VVKSRPQGLGSLMLAYADKGRFRELDRSNLPVRELQQHATADVRLPSLMKEPGFSSPKGYEAMDNAA
jgi:hypothetical protein